MRTTPKGSLYALYKELTKGELFWAALTFYELAQGDNAPIENFVQYIKDEAANRINQNGLEG